jgi:hypothetical protein
MHFAQEVLDPEELKPAGAKLSAVELKMAKQLIEWIGNGLLAGEVRSRPKTRLQTHSSPSPCRS